MTSYSALSPVAAGVFAVLNVAALTALAPGGIGDDIAQGTGYPFVLVELNEKAMGGFGTKPGLGMLPEIDLRVHVFSQFQGWSEAQAVMATVLQLLADPPTVSGFASWAIFHDRTIQLADEAIAGVKVKELVALFRLYVEEGAAGTGGGWMQSGWTQA